MPVQSTIQPLKDVVDPKKRGLAGDNHHQTPPPKKKAANAKNERASMLCNTPPTCIKDKDSHVEYTRKEFLGEGGFARCYLVTNRQGRPFAAKVVAKASLKTPKAKGKLIGEIKVHQSLQHPNIVRYQECFEDKNNVYIILELCENKSLLDMLRKRKRLTEPEVRFFMLQILGATKYMHDKRVIHRDLKLGNLFLDSKMNVKLGDFGLAALLVDDNERKRTICGTPNYIAPEVLCDNGVGHSYEVDLWSIGVIMYALLVGKPPFQSKEVKSIYRKIKDNQYDFPTTSPISQDAQDLITSLLCPEPNNRPSIDEISDHSFFHAGEMPREIPLSTLVHTPKWDPISRPLSELNWRYVSVQAGLGKNVQVGQEAGKSVQACIASNENPLKNHITRLREQESGVEAVKNVLPMAVSPRVPAPQVGGLTESRLMGKGAKRSINKVVPSDEDKENIVGNAGTGSLKRKGTVLKRSTTRATAQQAFVDIPEEEAADVKEEQLVKRRLAPPLRKPSGEMAPPAPSTSTRSTVSSTKSAPIVSHATLSQRVAALRAEVKADQEAEAASGPKRVLRGNRDLEQEAVRPPTQAELNVPSRVPARVQAQRANLKRTKTEDNLKNAADLQVSDDLPPVRLLRSRPQATTSNIKVNLPDSKIPVVKSHLRESTKSTALAETLRAMGDNLTLALNTPSKRLSSQFHRDPTGVPTFVMRWVDYTAKYGLAYQLSNSLAGMYFNDCTSITLSSDGLSFDYLSKSGEETTGMIGQQSPELEKKIKIATRYKGYMTNKLHAIEHTDGPTTDTKIFLAGFQRASSKDATNAVLFRMSDNAFQINFPDHSKVVLWDNAKAVRYVDKRGDVHIWSLAEAVSHKGEVVERLKIAAKELFGWADLIVQSERKV